MEEIRDILLAVYGRFDGTDECVRWLAIWPFDLGAARHEQAKQRRKTVYVLFRFMADSVTSRV